MFFSHGPSLSLRFIRCKCFEVGRQRANGCGIVIRISGHLRPGIFELLRITNVVGKQFWLRLSRYSRDLPSTALPTFVRRHHAMIVAAQAILLCNAEPRSDRIFRGVRAARSDRCQGMAFSSRKLEPHHAPWNLLFVRVRKDFESSA